MSLFEHVLAQTRQNVELLVAHGQISEQDGKEILSRLSLSLPKQLDDASVVSLAKEAQGLRISPTPSRVEARAIWGWTSEDPNDLSFDAGEVIQVITETNADWWTGRNRSGKQGLFPSNYVEKLPPRSVSPILVPEPRQATGPVEQRYASPALPHPQPYPAAPQSGYYPPAGPPPGVVNHAYGPPVDPGMPQPAPQQAPAKKNKFGALGHLMAQSAASGAGFGAGAAIGSGIVNTIF